MGRKKKSNDDLIYDANSSVWEAIETRFTPMDWPTRIRCLEQLGDEFESYKHQLESELASFSSPKKLGEEKGEGK